MLKRIYLFTRKEIMKPSSVNLDIEHVRVCTHHASKVQSVVCIKEIYTKDCRTLTCVKCLICKPYKHLPSPACRPSWSRLQGYSHMLHNVMTMWICLDNKLKFCQRRRAKFHPICTGANSIHCVIPSHICDVSMLANEKLCHYQNQQNGSDYDAFLSIMAYVLICYIIYHIMYKHKWQLHVLLHQRCMHIMTLCTMQST